MKQEIVLVGGGGHCAASIDVIEAQGSFDVAGIVDLNHKLNQSVSGYRIIGCDSDLPELVKRYRYFLITIGQLKTADKRKEKFEYLEGLGAEFAVIVSPSGYVTQHCFIDEGTIVMHKAFVGPNVSVGKNCIVNTAAVIEHDTVVGDHCHISTGCVVNGSCRIGDGVFVGSNSVMANNISIADNAVIGAGSVVVSSITDSGIYAGNPVKRLEVNV